MYKLYARTIQKILQVGAYALDFSEPELLFGKHSIDQLAQAMCDKNFKRILIVTDRGLIETGLVDTLIQNLEDKRIQFSLYYDVKPNPSIESVEKVANMYKTNGCEAIIAFGGGSVIDCGKAAGIKISNPNKPISDYKGLLKVHKDTPYFVAVPTTSGTGSEATLAAVVTEKQNNQHLKYAIMDTKLIPNMAVLDPTLTIGLPKNLTAHTGMDALSHAVEAFIGHSNTWKTARLSKKVVRLVYENLECAYNNGKNLEARRNMQNASYYAGVAFGRAYVGNIHALSHAITAHYGVPHGYTNAIIMPIILRNYGKKSVKQLAKLSDVIGLTRQNSSNTVKANAFIKRIEQMNQNMGIPNHIPKIRERDMDTIVAQVQSEANPLYPAPKIYSKQEMKQLLYQIKGE